MKGLRILTVCALIGSALPALGQAAETKPNLTLVTWNVQLLPTAFDQFTPKLRKMQAIRTPWIVAFLNEQDYDVVCLQEVFDQRLTKQLAQGLEPVYPHQVMPQCAPGKPPSASNGILFVSRIPIRYVTHIVYENITGIDAVSSKGMTLIELEHNGVTVRIGGTHLQAGSQAMRDLEYVEINQGIIAPYREAGVPQIIMGDFNTAAGTEQFDLMLETTEMTAFPIDDPRPYTADGTNSWLSRRTRRGTHIDHVLLNPRGTNTTIVRQTIQRPRREYKGKQIDLADHYGVVAHVAVQP